MKALLKKDFYSQKTNILNFISFYFILNIIFRLVKKDFENVSYLYTGGSFIGLFIIMDDLLRSEKEGKSMAYTLAMPVSKKDYINEKLIFAFIIIILLTLSNLIILLLLSNISGLNLITKEFFSESATSVSLNFIIVNLTIRWYSFAGEGAFFLSMFACILVYGLVTTWLYPYLDSGWISEKFSMAIKVIIYILFNDLIRRSSIKKMEKVRF